MTNNSKAAVALRNVLKTLKAEDLAVSEPPPKVHGMDLDAKETSAVAFDEEATKKLEKQQSASEDDAHNGKKPIKGVIEIPSTYTPLQAAKVLWENNILGAPVWDESSKEYWGFFDMRDFTSAIVNSHVENLKSYDPHDTTQKTTTQELLSKWLEEKHVTVKNLSTQNPFISCLPTSSLEEISPHLTEHRCHRIPIMGANGKCQSIITQSALVKAMAEHVEDQEMLETLQQANFPYKKDVVAVKDTTTAGDVFQLLVTKGLSGIAIVDEESGKLVGNTSARDIKLAVVDTSGNASLHMDILSYLSAVRQATPTKNDKYPTSTVHEDSCTVGHAIRLLAKTGYHRVFVVDNNSKPIGVISVADVIRFVVG